MNELIIQDSNNPIANIKQSTDIAGACKEIVTKTAINIQGRKYLPVEGWMSIATAHGCVGSISKVEPVEGNINFVRGYKAIAEIRRITDNMLISTAEGFVGEDEPVWFGGESEVYDKQTKRKIKKILPKRPDFAIRAMAQTRALSRACRSAFAHIVILMDAGLSTTPAEEMGHEIEIKKEEINETIQVPISKEPIAYKSNQPVKSTLEETFSKYKTAISESIAQFDISRFIKANGTFQKYIDKLPQEIFEEYEHFVNQMFSRICDAIEMGSITVTQDQEKELITINNNWKLQIQTSILNGKKSKEEEAIF
jgi:hypothetical protein